MAEDFPFNLNISFFSFMSLFEIFHLDCLPQGKAEKLNPQKQQQQEARRR